MAYQTINPYTEQLVKAFRDHTNAQLEAIIAKAEETYENDWSLRSLAARKAIVSKAASILREKLDEFAKPITVEMGKLFREAQGEVELSADILNYYADNAEKFLAPEKLEVDEGEALSSTHRWACSSALSPGTSPTINWRVSRDPT
jgi:succinate-semialdehyde dehydrogenase / glutarate-semialdehyde dehydrogenase